MAEKESLGVAELPSPLSTKVTDAPLSGIDPKIEGRILRKLDFQMMPALWFLFLVSFVDKGNIGNAKIQGMDKALHLTGDKYNIAVMVFTIAYITFGVPANVMFKKIGTRSLPVMMFVWAFFALGQGLTKTWGGLVACRFLMGIFEAGFVPGCAYLIGSYYKRDEFLRRYAVFFSASIIAGAFNGLLSALLAKANGAGGLQGWQWIFVVEGTVTGVVAVIVFFTMFKFPENTNMFTPEEKAVLLERNRRDGGQVGHESIGKHVLEALCDWKILLALIAYSAAEENASAATAFQPTVLKGLGYTSNAAQIHSIPIYCTALVISLSAAWLSDRLRKRYWFALLGSLITLIGNIIEYVHPRPAIRYMGMFFIVSGTYIVMPTIVVWAAINVGKGYKRTVAFGLVIGTGNFSALISSNVFITKQSPVYKTGFSVGIAMCCLSIACSTALYLGLHVANKKKARKQSAVSTPSDLEELRGEKDPNFIYQL